MKIIALLVGTIVTVCCAKAQNISYERQVAPILARRCSVCHGQGPPPFSPKDERNPGGLNTTNYTSLMKGDAKGSIINLGSPRTSKILRHPSSAEQALCDAYEKRLARFGPRAFIPQEAQPTPQESAACQAVKHPSLPVIEASIISAWISQGAIFDAEPSLKNCIQFRNVKTSNETIEVLFRALDPGVITLSILDSSSDQLTASYSKTEELHNGAGAKSSFYVFDKLPGRVDLRLCQSFSSNPFGLTAGIGLPDDDLNLVSVDPPIVNKLDQASVTFTRWQNSPANAELTIVPENQTVPAFSKKNFELTRGLNRILWDMKASNGSQVSGGDYVAYITIMGANGSVATLAFLFRIE